MNRAGLCLTGRRGDAPYIPAMSKQYELRRLPMGEPWQIVDYDPSRGLPQDPSKVYDNYWFAHAAKLKLNSAEIDKT
jgi:hypothetical protein